VTKLQLMQRDDVANLKIFNRIETWRLWRVQARWSQKLRNDVSRSWMNLKQMKILA